jgi:isoleucyl-tRNA synthetase
VPKAGQNRLRGMIEDRPDWVLSRQRAWGVPIAVFVNDKGEVLKDEAVNKRIFDAFMEEGADAWFADGAAERFLGSVTQPMNGRRCATFSMCGSIQARPMPSASNSAKTSSGRQTSISKAPTSTAAGSTPRCWKAAARVAARPMMPCSPTASPWTSRAARCPSRSATTVPQDVIKQYGADILRLWVASVDYAEDQRIGPEILKSNVDAYRKLRNTIRWMLGSLAHFKPEDAVEDKDMPELERLMLSHLARLDGVVRKSYDEFDFRRIYSALGNFMNIELSSFYFDVRKDALYCDAPSSLRRRAALTVIDKIFNCVVTWLAPILTFTCDEAWMERHGADACVHTEQFPEVGEHWRNEALEATWAKVMKVRSVVTGALEIERREKRIGSSLDSAPEIFIVDEELLHAVHGIDMAEICITSDAKVTHGAGPDGAYKLDEVHGVALCHPRRKAPSARAPGRCRPRSAPMPSTRT